MGHISRVCANSHIGLLFAVVRPLPFGALMRPYVRCPLFFRFWRGYGSPKARRSLLERAPAGTTDYRAHCLGCCVRHPLVTRGDGPPQRGEANVGRMLMKTARLYLAATIAWGAVSTMQVWAAPVDAGTRPESRRKAEAQLQM